MDFHHGPGRPSIIASHKRQNRSVTLSPRLIDEFAVWADNNDLSFSRGVEKAIGLLMYGEKNATKL
jgi:hypothetical protein